MAEPRRPGTGLLLAAAVALAAALPACGDVPGRPRPQQSPPPSSPTTGSGPTEIESIDWCQVLTSDDYPFVPNERFPSRATPQADGGCRWRAVKGDLPTDYMSTNIDTRDAPFSEFEPPASAPNGRSTEIAGRPAWTYTALSAQVGLICEAAFGSAGITVFVGVLDETTGHPDPCVTVIELAEIVASRVPPPGG